MTMYSSQNFGGEGQSAPASGAVLCVMNPAAGALGNTSFQALIEREMKARSIRVWMMTPEGLDKRDIAANREIGTVIACGGDGTVNSVANAMDNSRQILAVLPAGRGNSVARDLGVGRLEAALANLQSGEVAELDAIQVLFRNASGRETKMLALHAIAVGALPNVVRAAKRKSQHNAFGYVLSALLNQTKSQVFEVFLDGTLVSAKPRRGAIALNTSHLSFHVPWKGVRLDDGELDLILHPTSFLAEKLTEVTIVAGMRAIGVTHHRFRNLRIVSRKPTSLYLDGEVYDEVIDVHARVLPSFIRAIRPRQRM